MPAVCNQAVPAQAELPAAARSLSEQTTVCRSCDRNLRRARPRPRTVGKPWPSMSDHSCLESSIVFAVRAFPGQICFRWESATAEMLLSRKSSKVNKIFAIQSVRSPAAREGMSRELPSLTAPPQPGCPSGDPGGQASGPLQRFKGRATLKQGDIRPNFGVPK